MMSRFFGALGRFFIGAGIVTLLFVGYQLWGTGLQEASAQNNLASDFDLLLESVDVTAPTTTVAVTEDAPETTTTTTIPEVSDAVPIFDDQDLADKLFREGGEAVAQIQIPQLDVDKYVVQGVQVEDLRDGPGHYRATVFPGQEGNSGIAGHRTTYGAPFNRIDELLPGDEFDIVTVQGVHTYRVMSAEEAFNGEVRGTLGPDYVLPADASQVGHIIVPPSATWVLGEFGDDRVTLTACHPKYSAAQRIVVAATLVSAPVESLEAPEDYVTTDGQLVDEDFSAEDLALEAAGTGDPDNIDPVPVDPVDSDSADDTDGENDLASGVGDVVDSDPTPPETAAFADDISLDEGLTGEKDALRPAMLFMAVALLFFFAFKELGRRWKPWPALLIGIAPVLFFMALSFESFDRYLPAG